MVRGLVHQLDEENGGLVLERDTRIGVHVLQYLVQVVHLSHEGARVGAHPLLAEVPSEPWRRRVVEGIGPVGAIQLNRAEEHENAAL